MENFFNGKVAVVTGAGGTLCSEISKFLGSQGAKVALIGRTEAKLLPVAEAIRDMGGTALVIPADVNDEASMEAAAAKVLQELGNCNMLINGAGGNQPKAMTANEAYTPEELEPDFDKIGFFNLDLEVYKSVLCTNTLGSVIPTRVFAKQMIAVGGGSILNFASMNTYCPLTKVPAYAMAKAAVSNFTQWLGGYLAPAGIRVNAIAPGFFANERSIKFLGTPETGLSPRGQKVIDHTPMGRFGFAPDLVGCAEWLLNDEKSAFVTGITVPIDGGFLTRGGV